MASRLFKAMILALTVCFVPISAASKQNAGFKNENEYVLSLLGTSGEAKTPLTEVEIPRIKVSHDSKSQASSSSGEVTDSQLASFIEDLRSFVNETHYDAVGFISQMDSLDERLHKIDQQVRKLNVQKMLAEADSVELFLPPTDSRMKQLRFARHMFQVMQESIKDLKFFSSSSIAHHLIRCLVQLNVMLFAFFDSEGSPDPTIEGYSKKIWQFRWYLSYWETMYFDLPRQSRSVYFEFAKLVVAAKNSLRMLSRSDPGKAEPGRTYVPI